MERLVNGQGDPVLLAFAVKEIKDNSARAHRPPVCDSVVEACRWRHFYSPADIDFPDVTIGGQGVSHSLTRILHGYQMRKTRLGPAKLNLGNGNEG